MHVVGQTQSGLVRSCSLLQARLRPKTASDIYWLGFRVKEASTNTHIHFGPEFDGGCIYPIWINDMNINYSRPWTLLVFDSLDLCIDTDIQCHKLAFRRASVNSLIQHFSQSELLLIRKLMSDVDELGLRLTQYLGRLIEDHIFPREEWVE